jgi:hypothetical protein
MVTKIQNYDFDGDPDGLKFIGLLSLDEFESMRYCIENKGDAHLFDSYNKYHYEVTKSAEHIYMVSKVQPASSSSWL